MVILVLTSVQNPEKPNQHYLFYDKIIENMNP
jgi:hypothetical protein